MKIFHFRETSATVHYMEERRPFTRTSNRPFRFGVVAPVARLTGELTLEAEGGTTTATPDAFVLAVYSPGHVIP